mgnify:CR=1 FL=1
MPFTNTIGSNTIQGYRDLGGGVNDPLFNDVILLLQPTGVDDQAFDDKSQYNFSSSINAVRGAIPLLETSNNKWGSNYKVINLNNTSSHIICADYIPNLIASSSSPDTWTVEMWFMFDSVPNAGQQFNLIHFGGNTFGGQDDNPHVDNYISLWAGHEMSYATDQHFYAIVEENGAEVVQTDLATYTTGQYYHVAIVNNNKSIDMYIDGTRVVNRAITSTVRGSYGDNDRDSFQIGADQDSATTNDYADIRIAGVRVTRNQARYSGTSFTVPNQPFSLRGTTANILGGDSSAPITSEVEGLRYLDHFNLGNTPALAWIQHPRVNGGNAYQAYILKDSGYLWVLAAKLASSGLNSQIYTGSAVTGTQSGFPSFTWQDFPAGSTVNDWGVDTHTYNATAYDTTTTKSMRTRIWPELRSKYKRIYVADWTHADGGTQNPSGRILYIQNRGRYNENEIGVNQSWGEFMENPAADDPSSVGMGQNDNQNSGGGRFGGLGYPDDTTHIWPNESDGSNALPVAGMKKYSNSWGFAGLDYLYLGATDREQTTANTNDCAMISGATTERIPSAMPTNDGALGTAGIGGMNSITGIGVKRSRISTANGFAIEFDGNQTTSTTPPPAPSPTASSSEINAGGYHGNFCTLMGNGRVEVEGNARMNFWTRLQGGNGSTIDRAFDGSLMELDSLWYNNAIPNGVYWFKSSVLGIVAVDVVTRGGTKWIQIPFGTSTSSSGVTLTSAKISDRDSPAVNLYVFNIGTGQSTVANLTFDSDNRLGNGDVSIAGDHNKNIGWGIWNVGIPFRQLQYNMTFKSHWATGGGGSNADWNDYKQETPWNPTAIQPDYTGGDWPFVMIPDPADPLNKMINVNGHTGQSSTYRTSGWTGSGDQGVVTRSMETTTTIEMGQVASGARQDEHAAEAYRVGVGFAGFGKETYRAESGFFYIR